MSRKTGKSIVKIRFKYLVEVAFVFIGLLLIFFPILFVVNFIDSSSPLYGSLFYLSRVLGLLVGLPLLLYIIRRVIKWDSDISSRNQIGPSRSYLKLFKVTKSNFKYQLLYGILLLFLVFIPLDFIFYLIPSVIEYSFVSLTLTNTNSYLLNENYIIFLISVLIIQISVAFYEESIVRGFLAKRGSDYFLKMSGVMISSFYFGFAHLAYIIQPITFQYNVLFPVLWCLQAFLIGIILSLFTLRKYWIFPAIFAHACNNIISAHTLWLWNQSFPFLLISIYLYFPLMVIGLMLFIWQYSRIKNGVKNGFKEFKAYFGNVSSEGESGNDKYKRILVDFVIGVIIFFMAYIMI